jgi:hypothetical protein
MSFRATTLWRRHLFAVLLGLSAIPALAQVANSPIVFSNQDAIITSFVTPQNLGGSASDNSQWLKVEFHYSVTPPDGTGDYVNGATFKVWVEGRDLFDPTGKPGEGIAVALTGEVSYVNLYKGKDVYGVVYLHPSTIGRYNAGGGASDFDRKFNIHVEADVDGKPVDAIDKKKEQDLNWYTALKPVSGLLFLQNQTPFIMTDSDRYPALKLPDSK